MTAIEKRVADLGHQVEEANRRTALLTKAVEVLNRTVEVSFGPKIHDLEQAASEIVPRKERRRHLIRGLVAALVVVAAIAAAIVKLHAITTTNSALTHRVAAEQATIDRNQRFSNLGLCYTIVLIGKDLKSLLDNSVAAAQAAYNRTLLSPSATAMVRASAKQSLDDTVAFAQTNEKTLPNIDCSVLPAP